MHWLWSLSALMAGLTSGPLPSAEPPVPTRYDGRTLTEWRERIQRLDYKSADIADEVPGLLAIAQDAHAPWFSRRQAALTLGRIGVPAKSAIPAIVELLNEQTADPEQSTQLWAIKTLALYGPVAEESAPALVALLEDSTQPPLPRLASIEALGRIGPARSEVMPAVVRALDAGLAPSADPDTLERGVAAAEILELFRSHAGSVTPSLIRATTSESVLFRRAAANTLGLIGPAADPAIPALADLVLFDDVAEVRDLAARALGRIGPDAEPVLVQLLEDTDPEVRLRAATACRELRSASPAIIAALQIAAEDRDAMIRVISLDSLWSVSRDKVFVAPRALAELTSDDREIRMRAVQILERLGPDLHDSLPQLRSLAADERAYVAQAARRVLRSYEEPSDSAPTQGTADER
jgi:HEAT repeat protein